jgi:hypothetical protein
VRSESKDQDRLSPIGKFYVDRLETAAGPTSEEQDTAARLVQELQRRGKWPAKPDLVGWYGRKGSRWRDPRTGAFKRCVTMASDPELFTRHEVHEAPPDVLVTNYSMLEYMLMRPLERPVFDRTRTWLSGNPYERFLLVIDEAHLYRGAGGAEVALLIRRLRMRLGIEPDRLQVICTSASFHSSDYAVEFGAQLTGKDPGDFRTVTGTLNLREPASRGNRTDAEALARVDVHRFYQAETDEARLAEVKPFLEYRGVSAPWTLEPSLHQALVGFAPLALLTNLTMREALPIADLASTVFAETDAAVAARAATTLLALASVARRGCFRAACTRFTAGFQVCGRAWTPVARRSRPSTEAAHAASCSHSHGRRASAVLVSSNSSHADTADRRTPGPIRRTLAIRASCGRRPEAPSAASPETSSRLRLSTSFSNHRCFESMSSRRSTTS